MKAKMKDSFIAQTARDYDLSCETVRHIYNLYWPDNFYERLEEIISLRKNSGEAKVTAEHKA